MSDTIESTQTAPPPSFETAWAALKEVSANQKETDRIVKETASQIKETERIVKETSLQMKETDRQMKETGRRIDE